jgi:uncharacterized protein (DUF1330 family)
MRTALAMVAGIATGALAIQGLHAQQTSPASQPQVQASGIQQQVYFIAEIDVNDPEGYGKEYSPKAQQIIKAAGGRILAVGGAGGGPTPTTQITQFGGDSPKRVVIQLWDNLDKIKAWQTNPEYVELRKIGEKYAKFRAYAVPASQQTP